MLPDGFEMKIQKIGTNKDPLYLKVKEVAEWLNVPEQKIHSMVNDGEIPHVRIVTKTRKIILFKLDSFRCWLKYKKSLI